MILKQIFFFIFIFIFYYIYSNDSTKLLNNKSKFYPSPRKAAIYSALLPGLGQAYNKSWWKIPIIYGGLATFAYLTDYNQKKYSFIRKNLIAQTDNDPHTINQTALPSSQLSELKRQYKNRRDLCIAATLLVYVLQIMEAHVDAHLKTYDISDNLTLSVEPSTNNGIYLSVQFKIKY